MRFLILLVSAFLALAAADSAEKKIVCYLGTWAAYRQGAGKFEIEDIDTSLCTHVIYTFVGLGSDNKVKSLDPWLDSPDGEGSEGKQALARFNALHKKNPNIKTLVAIGGWNEGSAKYSKMAAKSSSRAKFIASVIKFMKKHKFDGFDVDWEYPTQRGGNRADLKNFIVLLKELKEAFDKNGGFLLSAAVGAGEGTASQAYDIKEMNKYLDFINLMTYDFYVGTSGIAGANAALYGGKSASANDKKNNVDAAVQYWIAQGASRDKLILGTPTYGHTFNLASSRKNGPESKSTGPGAAGPFTKQPGMLGYNEICVKLNKGQWTAKYDEERRVPYAYNGKQWISYDDIESMKEKAEYAMKEKLGGAMIWSIETDDFKGKCGEKYPLLKTLNHVLRKTKEVTDHKPTSPAMKPMNLLMAQDSSEFIKSMPLEDAEDDVSKEVAVPEDVEIPGECEEEGRIPHLNEPTHFVVCKADGNGGYIKYDMSCPADLIWDAEIDACNWNQENKSPEEEPMDLLMAQDSSEFVKSMPLEDAEDEISKEDEVPEDVEIPGECEEEGRIPHLNEPTHFVVCKADGNGGFIKYDMSCPEPLIWDAEIGVCNWNRGNKSPEEEPMDLLMAQDSSEFVKSMPLEDAEDEISKEDEVPEDVEIPGECEEEGRIPHLNEPTHFVVCKADGNGGFIKYDMSCPEPLIWDAEIGVCNWNRGNKSPEEEPMDLLMAQDSSEFVKSMPLEDAEDEISKEDEVPEDVEIPGECEEEGRIPHLNEPTHFVVCKADGNGGFIKYDMSCPEPLIWDAEIGVCNWNRGNKSPEEEPMDLLMAQDSSEFVKSMPLEDAEDEISKEDEVPEDVEIPGECEEEGRIPHLNEPTHFVVCKADGNGGFIKYDMSCPEPLIWDAEIGVCNWNRGNKSPEEEPMDLLMA